MRGSIDSLLDLIYNTLQTSDERIMAAAESKRQSDAYITTSREAIKRSNQQLARLRPIAAMNRVVDPLGKRLTYKPLAF